MSAPTDPSAKHPDFIYHGREPLNGGPPPALQRGSFRTPVELFYVRNHGPVPEVPAAADYRLEVAGLVARARSLSLAELRRDFPRHTVAATLQCAGLRRDELQRVKPIPGETPWAGDAISHAVWGGARLADVLAAAGVTADTARGGARHVEFLGHDAPEKEGAHHPYGASVPLEKALGPETLLAYEMNGAALPALHGAPLRAIVPGYVGARSVKWLRAVRVRPDPSPNFFMTEEYRLHPADVADQEHADFTRALPLMDVPVNSFICRVEEPPDGANGRLTTAAEGWAFVGGGREIARVEVSADGGAHWTQAQVLPPDDGAGEPDEEAGRWSWRFWRAEVSQAGRPAPGQLVVRAWDTAANVQPRDPVDRWNFKGYSNNAWHRWPTAGFHDT